MEKLKCKNCNSAIQFRMVNFCNYFSVEDWFLSKKTGDYSNLYLTDHSILDVKCSCENTECDDPLFKIILDEMEGM